MYPLSKVPPTLCAQIDSFLVDRRAKGLAAGSITFYREYLKIFADYCQARGVADIESLTPTVLREIMLAHSEGHNPGGCHSLFRSIRAFIRWYELEFEPPGFKSPLHKVKAPKLPTEPLTPVSLEDVFAMVATCKHGRKLDDRDRAILLALIDTGVRAGELLALNVDDVNLATGEILVRQGKGRKPRAVFAGHKTRKALRAYVRMRRDGALFTTLYGERLKIRGLRAIVKRRAKAANITRPSLHSFRRAFAINCLRAGMDIFSLKRLMGHTSLTVLQRYLAQNTDDLRTAHAAASPVDRAGM